MIYLQKITASIVTYNDGDKVLTAVKTLLEHTKKYPFELYVFDNNSSDTTPDILQNEFGDKIHVIKNEKNIGFGAAHNKIFDYPVGDYHFVINPDITVSSDVLSDTVDFMAENPDIVMTMPKILNSDSTIQYLPKEIPTFKRLFLGRLAKYSEKFQKIRDEYTHSGFDNEGVVDIDFCSGCFFCMKGEVYKALGGFDERYFMYLEDADLTLRAKKCGRVVQNNNISVTHLWERTSAKSVKYLIIHLISYLKFSDKRRKKLI